MKRNFEVPVKDYDGRPHLRALLKYDAAGAPVMLPNGNQEIEKYVPATLRTYALDALAGRWPGEEKIDGAERMRLYHKICFSKDGVVDVEPAEVGHLLQALTNQGRSFLVIDAMQTLLNTDPPA